MYQKFIENKVNRIIRDKTTNAHLLTIQELKKRLTYPDELKTELDQNNFKIAWASEVDKLIKQEIKKRAAKQNDDVLTIF